MKPVIRSIIYISTCLLPALHCYGQEITPQQNKAYIQVLQLEQPEPFPEPFGAYLNSFSLFLEALLDGTPHAISNFEAGAEQALEIIPEDDLLLNRFCRNEIILQMAFIRLKENQELAALWLMRQAYRQASENIQQNPEYAPFQRTWGLLQILIGAVPDNYQWVPKLFGFHGDIEKGRMLLSAVPPDHWLHLEARAILSLTDSYLLEEPERAVQGFAELMKNGPESPLFHYLYITMLLRGHEAVEAIGFFESKTRHLPLTSYAAGNAYLQAGRYPEAIRAFHEFEENYNGDDFRKDTAYKLFLAYYLLDDPVNAGHHFDRIVSTGATSTESDRYAARMHEQEYPDKRIMRIRLATDGGLYDKAGRLASRLSEDDFNRKEDRIEFVYRKARLHHFTREQGLAEEAYLRTIEMQGEERLYFAPNSCLQLGYIYLDQKRMTEAQEYFRKTFDYRGYEYKKGIDRKAHSALVTYF